MSAKQNPRKIIVLSFDDFSYADLWHSVSKKISLEKIFLFQKQTPMFNKLAHVKDIFRAMFHRKKLTTSLKEDDVIILLGHILLPFLLHNFLKLRRSRNHKIFVFSVFFHNPKLMNLYGRLIRLLIPDNLIFIAFSKADIPLYKKYFHLDDSQIIYVPYGSGPIPDIQPTQGNYCFAGGYSNRNYDLLLESFAYTDKQLIICCSAHNKLNAPVPKNVKIFYDLPKPEFSQMCARAKICILPLHEISGASGQSVTLQYMQFGKPIIATEVPAIEDYLSKQNSILISPNSALELVDAVNILWNDEQLLGKLGQSVQTEYIEKFQRTHFEDNFLSCLQYHDEKDT